MVYSLGWLTTIGRVKASAATKTSCIVLITNLFCGVGRVTQWTSWTTRECVISMQACCAAGSWIVGWIRANAGSVTFVTHFRCCQSQVAMRAFNASGVIVVSIQTSPAPRCRIIPFLTKTRSIFLVACFMSNIIHFTVTF